MSPEIFVCIMPTGIWYTDKTREEHGDYKVLGYLLFGTLKLHVEDDCPQKFRKEIEEDAIQYKVGEPLRISSSGQTITLGYAV